MNTQYAAPAVTSASGDTAVDAEWAVAGAVAAVLGLAVSTVAYICGVCEARSFDACLQAVKDYFGDGC